MCFVTSPIYSLFIGRYEELHLIVRLELRTRDFYVLEAKRQEKRLTALFIGNASHAVQQRRSFAIALSKYQDTKLTSLTFCK